MGNFNIKLKAVMLLLTILCSCGTINNGIIVEKKYYPSRTLYANGVYNQKNEKYQIIINGANRNNRHKRKKITVSKQEYDSLQVGSKYLINN